MLHPEPPEGAAEATKSFKHLGRRSLKKEIRELAGHNMSEHRASLERYNAEADSLRIRGRLKFCAGKTQSLGMTGHKSIRKKLRRDLPG